MKFGADRYEPWHGGGGESARPRRGLLSRLFGGAGAAAEPAVIEQRERMRHEVSGAATLTEMDRQGMPGRSWPVEIINLSKGGAAVSTGVFVSPGTLVMLQFPGGNGAPPRQLMATVLHIRRQDELVFAAGVKFESRGRMGGGSGTYNLSAGA